MFSSVPPVPACVNLDDYIFHLSNAVSAPMQDCSRKSAVLWSAVRTTYLPLKPLSTSLELRWRGWKTSGSCELPSQPFMKTLTLEITQMDSDKEHKGMIIRTVSSQCQVLNFSTEEQRKVFWLETWQTGRICSQFRTGRLIKCPEHHWYICNYRFIFLNFISVVIH